MVAIEQLHWLWWAGGIAITLIGFAIMLWAMLADRSRGRRRCPKCWYDLSHSHGMRCSECGHEPRTEKRLFRTRRRWKWAFAGSLVLLLSPGALGWRVAQRNWITHGPDTALIASLWWMDDPSEVLKQLSERLSGRYLHQPSPCFGCMCGCPPPRKYPVLWDDQLWNWQWKLLATRLSAIAENKTPGWRTAWWIMRWIPDKRLVDDAIIFGLRDLNPRAFRHAIEVCSHIDAADELNDELIAAFAETLPRTVSHNFDLLFRLIASHSEHAAAALPILLRDLPELCGTIDVENEHHPREKEMRIEATAMQYLLMIEDFARKSDQQAAAIKVIRSIAASSSTSRWVRVAAVQAMLALAPVDGVQLLPLLPQRDRREVLRYTMHRHPELATRISDLSTYPENERIREDILQSITPEFTPMDCFFELLGEIEASNGLPRPYQAYAEDMGGLLGGLRNSRALNALLPSSRPGADNMGGVLFMLRQIRELNAQMPVRDKAGRLVMPQRESD